MLLKANGNKIKWHGWTYTGATEAKMDKEIELKIGETSNISITANLYADSSIAVNLPSTPSTPSAPSTPDTSNNNP